MRSLNDESFFEVIYPLPSHDHVTFVRNWKFDQAPLLLLELLQDHRGCHSREDCLNMLCQRSICKLLRI